MVLCFYFYFIVFAEVDKKKFLVETDATVSLLSNVIRQRIQLEQHQALFIFINKSIPSPMDIVGNIYQREERREGELFDGFLYVQYYEENTFGNE
jgi:hypothetical protein